MIATVRTNATMVMKGSYAPLAARTARSVNLPRREGLSTQDSLLRRLALIDPDGRPIGFTWRYDRAELVADGVVHAAGVGLGIIGATILVINASTTADKTGLVSVVVYSAGLLAMLCFSAAYNLWPVSRAKWLLRRLDHSAIYLLIAATYTPFVLQLKSVEAATTLLICVWATAMVGIALKLLAPGRFDRLAVGLYLLLGWSGVIVADAIIAALPPTALWMLIAGGLLYTAGIVFHLWHSLRFQNAIWHTFVLLAAACHYSAVLAGVGLAE